MGVATGTFQYANGSPAANASFQWKLSTDAILFSGTAACVAPPLISGICDVNGNMTTTFAFNDVLSTTAGLSTFYQLTIKANNGGQIWNENYFLTGTAANINLIPPAGQGGVIVTTPVTSLPIGQIGDIIRYNVTGDGLWDTVNYAQKFAMLAVDGGQLPFTGASSGGATELPSSGNTNNFPTATDGWSRTYTSSASGSTSTVVGNDQGTGGNSSLYGIIAFQRLTIKLAIGNTTNCRFWLGLACWNNGSGAGTNGTVILGTTKYASDTPNSTTIGFRFSAGTDTHWQAVTAIGGGSQTTVDTGIVPDTNPHLFEIVTNAASTSIFYFIDRVLVATITTNIPTPGSADSSAAMFWSGDNKNTATAISGKFYYSLMSLK